MINRLCLALFAATILCGQDKPPEAKQEQPLEVAIIPVKTLTGDSFDRLVRLLGVFTTAHYSGDSQLRTIVVTAPKEVIAQMRHVVEELDRPNSEAAIGRNIEMTLTFLKCSTKAAAGPPLPPEIEAVAKQLRAATPYKDIQVWDSIPFHLQEGKDASQTLRLPGTFTPANAYATANIRIHVDAVGRRNQTRYVRFGQLNIGFRVPFQSGTFSNGNSALVNTQFTYLDLGLNTAGDFTEGQKTVLGKVSGTEDDSAVFVVVSLKVLD